MFIFLFIIKKKKKILKCTLVDKYRDFFLKTRCNPMWTRQDFGLVIHIHEIVFTNHSKGQK